MPEQISMIVDEDQLTPLPQQNSQETIVGADITENIGNIGNGMNGDINGVDSGSIGNSHGVGNHCRRSVVSEY